VSVSENVPDIMIIIVIGYKGKIEVFRRLPADRLPEPAKAARQAT